MCFIITCTTSVVNLCVLTYQNPVKRRWFICEPVRNLCQTKHCIYSLKHKPCQIFQYPLPSLAVLFQS